MRSLLTVLVCSLVLLATGVAGARLVRPERAAGGYLIRDVSVFTAVPGEPVLRHVDVRVEGDRITAISADGLDAGDAEVIDGRGKTLLPGLVDAHTHITGGMIVPWKVAMLPTPEHNLQAALFAGVTTVVDMSGYATPKMEALAQDLEAGRTLGPRLFHAGMGFTGVGCHPMPFVDKIAADLAPALRKFVPDVAIEIAGVDDLARVDAHLDAGPDFTKVYLDRIPPDAPLIDLELLRQIVERSHARDRAVVAHIGSNEDVRIALDVGVDGLAHGVYKEALDPALAAEIAGAGLFVIPTVVVFDNYHRFANEQRVDHFTALELDTTHPARRRALEHPRELPTNDRWAEQDRAVAAGVDHLHDNVALLKAHGVTLLAGSDGPNIGMSVGGTLHTELEHLVRGGLEPEEALRAATSSAAAVLGGLVGEELDFGTVETGARADLLLVRGDPTKDIAATRAIDEVFLGGERLRRRAPRDR